MNISMITLARLLRISMHGHDDLCPYKDEMQGSINNKSCSFCETIIKARISSYNSGYKDGYADALEEEY